MKENKNYISILLTALLLVGFVDFHGLSHLIEGDQPQQVEACDDCRLVFQQKEDLQYFILQPQTGACIDTSEITNITNVSSSISFVPSIFSSDYFNKPPPSFS